MDHVHQKRLATLKRRKEAELEATAARLHQQAGSPSAGEHFDVYGRESSRASDQLARLLSDDDEDWAASGPSANSSPSPSSAVRNSEEARATSSVFEKPPESIEMATPDRPYKMWKGEQGTLGENIELF